MLNPLVSNVSPAGGNIDLVDRCTKKSGVIGQRPDNGVIKVHLPRSGAHDHARRLQDAASADVERAGTSGEKAETNPVLRDDLPAVLNVEYTCAIVRDVQLRTRYDPLRSGARHSHDADACCILAKSNDSPATARECAAVLNCQIACCIYTDTEIA